MAVDYEAFRKRRNRENSFSAHNGMVITKLEKGHAVVEMDVDDTKLNPLGTIHGGCLFTMADVCAGAAASSYGNKVTTVNADINYLRAGKDAKHLIAENREIRAGRTLIVNDVIIKDERGRELVLGTFTFMVLGELHEDLQE